MPIFFACYAQSPSPALRQADAAYNAGVAALSKQDFNTARIDFENVVRLAPQAEQGHSALGAVLVSLGDRSSGIRELLKALAMKPSDSAAQLNLALAYEQDGSFAKALPLFAGLEAASRTSGHPLAPYVLAAYARALAPTRSDEAITRMQAAVSRDVDNAELHDELGSLLARREKWHDAQQQFISATQLNPDLASAHAHLALSLQALSMPGALEEFSRASQLAPHDEEINLQFAKALISAEQDQQAMQVLRIILAEDPRKVTAAYELGLVLQRNGDSQSAIPLFESFLSTNSNDPSALTNYGMALMQNQRAQDAISPLQKAVQLAPSMVTARQNLAAAYVQLNQLDEAVFQLKTALQLAPDLPQLHYNLGLAYKMQDNSASAIPELQTAETLNPSASEPPYVLGILYMQSAKYQDAAAELDKSLKLQPNNGDGWATLGSVYVKLDKLPEATAALQEAIRQLPDQADPHLTMATVLVKQGQTAQATAERKVAADLMRTHMNRQRAEVATNSANALLQNGKLDDAIAQFKEALSYDPSFADAHRNLALALDRKGDPVGAASERQKISNPEPSQH